MIVISTNSFWIFNLDRAIGIDAIEGGRLNTTVTVGRAVRPGIQRPRSTGTSIANLLGAGDYSSADRVIN